MPCCSQLERCGQVGWQRRCQAKDTFDQSSLGAAAHDFWAESVAQQSANGINQDRFACPCFAGDHVETVVPVDLKTIDDREVADRQLAEHSGVIMT